VALKFSSKRVRQPAINIAPGVSSHRAAESGSGSMRRERKLNLRGLAVPTDCRGGRESGSLNLNLKRLPAASRVLPETTVTHHEVNGNP
jgi:hypothetical protein